MTIGTDYKQPIQSLDQITGSQTANQTKNVKTTDKISNPGNSTGINNVETNSQIPSGVKNQEAPACSIKLDKHSAPTGQTFSQNKIQSNITGNLEEPQPIELNTIVDYDNIDLILDSNAALKLIFNDLKSHFEKPHHNVLRKLCAFIYNLVVELLGGKVTTLGQDDLTKLTKNFIWSNPEVMMFFNKKTMTDDQFKDVMSGILKKVNDNNKLLTNSELQLYPQTMLEAFHDCNTPDIREMCGNMYDLMCPIKEVFTNLFPKLIDMVNFEFKGYDNSHKMTDVKYTGEIFRLHDTYSKTSFQETVTKAVTAFDITSPDSESKFRTDLDAAISKYGLLNEASGAEFKKAIDKAITDFKAKGAEGKADFENAVSAAVTKVIDYDNQVKLKLNNAINEAVSELIQACRTKSPDLFKEARQQTTETGLKRQIHDISNGKIIDGGYKKIHADGMLEYAAQYYLQIACDELDQNGKGIEPMKTDNAALRNIDAKKRSDRYMLLRAIISRLIFTRVSMNHYPRFYLRRQDQTFLRYVTDEEQTFLRLMTKVISPDDIHLKAMFNSDLPFKINNLYLADFKDPSDE